MYRPGNTMANPERGQMAKNQVKDAEVKPVLASDSDVRFVWDAKIAARRRKRPLTPSACQLPGVKDSGAHIPRRDKCRSTKRPTERAINANQRLFPEVDGPLRKKSVLARPYRQMQTVRNKANTAPALGVIRPGVFVLTVHEGGYSFFGTTWDVINCKEETMRKVAGGILGSSKLSAHVAENGLKGLRFKIVEEIPVESNFDARSLEKLLESRVIHHRQRFQSRVLKAALRKIELVTLRCGLEEWKQRVLRHRDLEELSAALEIQRIWHGWKTRGRMKSLLQMKALAILHRTMTTYVWRRKISRRIIRRRQNAAALLIQRHCRGHKARRLVASIRRDSAEARLSTGLARIWRAHKLRGWMRRRVTATATQRRKQHIRMLWRKAITRTVHRERIVKIQAFRAARTIQQYWKVHQTHQTGERPTKIIPTGHFGQASEMESLQQECTSKLVSEESSARRSGLTTGSPSGTHLTVEESRKDMLARKIQRSYKRWRDQKRVEQIKQSRATVIQRSWRSAQSRRFRADQLLKKEAAATKIQRWYKYQRMHGFAIALLGYGRKSIAALRIQRCFRAYLARRLTAKMRLARKLGPCQECLSNVATLYAFSFERKLCSMCWEQLSGVMSDKRGFRRGWIGIEDFRRLERSSVKIQRAFRTKQAQLLKQFGNCAECENPSQRFCLHCMKLFCFFCADTLHSILGVSKAHGLYRMEEYEQLKISTIFLQQRYRFRAHLRRNENLARIMRSIAARKIQKVGRNYVIGLRQRRKIAEKSWQLDAAVTIQKAYRGWRARAYAAKLRAEWNAATHIQRYWRGHVARSLIADLHCQKVAASTLQKHWRGKRARNLRRILEAEKHLIERCRAATTIQVNFRAAKERHAIRTLWSNHMRSQHCRRRWGLCARVLGRLVVFAQHVKLQKKVQAATIIQCGFRRRKARIQSSHLRRLKDKKRESAAIYIQYRYRRHSKKGKQERAYAMLSRYMVRKKAYRELRRLATEREEKEDGAARNIQRAIRTYLASKSTIHPSEECATWLEYWDEHQQAPYYYNTITGETSWEKPLEFQAVSVGYNAGSNSDTRPDLLQQEVYDVETSQSEVGDDTSWENVNKDSQAPTAQQYWESYWDDQNQAWYYYNQSTGETSWERPETFFMPA